MSRFQVESREWGRGGEGQGWQQGHHREDVTGLNRQRLKKDRKKDPEKDRKNGWKKTGRFKKYYGTNCLEVGGREREK